ncbi:protein kinase [Streptomyces sp. NPDC102467]|uniref:protein kinase domain-containing protein n=1 Tax=Streptomyces sp. NPDC102467 TaxID=3366179 RepID=UPI003829C7E4
MLSALAYDDPVSIGPYWLTARLGSGGMGTVYLGRTSGGRMVALKTMHARIAADPDARTRFRLEVDAARVIGGRYGAPVVDADPFAETPWLATEYVLGPPLDDAVHQGGPFPERSVRVLGAALCGALRQLHLSDVVHRDLKPSNIMVTAYGPKVIDFGIARAMGDYHQLTRAGAAVGTPAFMSPEQATGQHHGAAGDVFALAGVLVFAATGRGAFGEGQAADLLYRVRYGQPDLTDVPVGLVSVLGRCLGKDPGVRPSTDELAHALHDGTGEFSAHLPNTLLAEIGRRATEVWQVAPQRLPTPAGVQEIAAPPARRTRSRRRFLAAGGLTAGVATTAGTVWWWRATPSSRTSKQSGRSGAAANQQNSTGLSPLWKSTDSHGRDLDLAPLVPRTVKGLILLCEGLTFAVDPRSGEEVWQAFGGTDSWQCSVDAGKAYRLFAPDDATGEESDSAPALSVRTVDADDASGGSTVAKFADVNGRLRGHQLLCVAAGVLYVAVGQGPDAASGSGEFLERQKWTLRAVDARSGRTLWTQPLPSRPDKSKRLHFLAAKVVGARLVTFQEPEEQSVRIVVRDTRTGEIHWQKPYTVEDPDTLCEGVTADDAHLYVSTGQLRALRLSDGGQVWTSQPAKGHGPVYGLPALKDGVLYAVARADGMVALDPHSGRRRWVEKAFSVGDPHLTCRPVCGDDHVYYRNGVMLRAVKLSTREAEQTYVTTGSQFFGDKQNGVLLAVDSRTVAAFPFS